VIEERVTSRQIHMDGLAGLIDCYMLSRTTGLIQKEAILIR
jgi:hypothetical protein